MDLYSGVKRPLVQGTLRGYREWQWGQVNWLPGLFPRGDFLWPANIVWTVNAGDAPHHVSPWLSDTWNEAVCARRESHQVPFPDRQCCGFYAKYQPRFNQVTPSVGVPGIIEAKGRIILGTTGFRAQQARIVALIRSGYPTVDPTRDNSIKAAEAYGVPLFKTLEEALEAFPPHDVEELLPELREERERRERASVLYQNQIVEFRVRNFSGDWTTFSGNWIEVKEQQ